MGFTRLFKHIEEHTREGDTVSTSQPRRAAVVDTGQEETRSHGQAETPKESTQSISKSDELKGRELPNFEDQYSWDDTVLPDDDPKIRWMRLSRASQLLFPEPNHPTSLPKLRWTKTWKLMLAQAAIPIFLAGCGLIFAGYYLLLMQKTAAFERWRELTVLVTPLLGIKAQLELTSVARFTLHLSLGHIQKHERLNYCVADMAVSLVQAILAGICSAYFAMFLVWIREGMPIRSGNSDVWIILAVSCSAACITCFLICILTMVSTLVCFHYKIDPNHVAVSIVAGIGDISTLGFLDVTARFLLRYEELFWIAPMLTVVILVMALFLAYVAYSHPSTKSSLWACWFPILLVVILSCFAGMLLEFEGKEFNNMELYQPLITGIGATIIAIHYSTISSDYFAQCKPGTLPGEHRKVCCFPTNMFCPRRVYAKTYFIVLGVVVVAQALFSLLIWLLIPSHSKECYGIFFSLYVISCLIQSAILLYLTHLLLNFLWKMKVDPGFYVIPCLHGFGDILGTLFLLMCCQTYKIRSCAVQSPGE